MKRTVATVKSVTGTCNAGYRVGDKIVCAAECVLDHETVHWIVVQLARSQKPAQRWGAAQIP